MTTPTYDDPSDAYADPHFDAVLTILATAADSFARTSSVPDAIDRANTQQGITISAAVAIVRLYAHKGKPLLTTPPIAKRLIEEPR